MSAKQCIKKVRYELGLSQIEFAELVGVHKAAISLYETGARTPSFPTIRKIVDKLKEKGIEIKYSDLRE